MTSSSRNPWVILTYLGAILWIVALGVAPSAVPVRGAKDKDKGDPVLGERIAGALVFDGRLWLRGTMVTRDDQTGGLVLLGLSDESRKVHFERGVIDLQKSANELWVLRFLSPKTREYAVSAWRKGAFEDLARFEASIKDDPVALLSSRDASIVLSQRSIRILSAGHDRWRVVELKGELRSGVQVSVATAANGGSIYVGMNMGEWGGGLQRADLETGVVTSVERRDTSRPCAGPLNRECDPVTGVIPDPANQDCVLAAVGLVHLGSSKGRILKVCGKTVTVVWEKSAAGGMGGREGMTEAVYGLVPSADGGYWAITWRALYRFRAGETREYALPELRRASGVHLSHELPGVIVLRTDVNWAVSTSGYSPLVVPLESPRP